MKVITQQQQFKELVLENTKLVIVSFSATWCMPCQTMKPVIARLEKQHVSYIDFVELDVDKFADLATQYYVRSIPTYILFSSGKPLQEVTGVVTIAALQKAFKIK